MEKIALNHGYLVCMMNKELTTKAQIYLGHTKKANKDITLFVISGIIG